MSFARVVQGIDAVADANGGVAVGFDVCNCDEDAATGGKGRTATDQEFGS